MYLCVSKIVFQRTEGAYSHSGSCCLIRAEQFPESGFYLVLLLLGLNINISATQPFMVLQKKTKKNKLRFEEISRTLLFFR